MIQSKQKRIAMGIAAGSSALSLIFWLQIGLGEISSWREPRASILDSEREVLIEPIVESHSAAAVDLDAIEAPADGDSISADVAAAVLKTDLQEWELRRAYAVSIPTLGIRVPVLLPSRTYWDKQEWGALEEQMQAGMLYGTVAYPHSSRPGAGGSLYIAGHSSPPSEEAKMSAFGAVFERLPEISVGVEIVVIDGDERFTYVVTDAFVVSASDTRILASGDEEDVLTLITCYPVGSARQRFVVRAKLVP